VCSIQQKIPQGGDVILLLQFSFRCKFLAYVLNVTQRVVVRIIPHSNVYFICTKLLQLTTENFQIKNRSDLLTI
jgi:hypothetical protein